MSIFIYMLMAIILFQNTIVGITHIKFINYIDEIFIASIFIVSIITIFKNKKINLFSLKQILLLSMFFLIGIISLKINSDFKFNQAISSGFLSIKFWLMVFSISNIKLSEKIKDYLIKSVMFFEKIVLIFAVLNLVMPNIFIKIFPSTVISYRFGLLSISSLFLHPGKFGWYMLFCAVVHLIKMNSNELSEKQEKKYIIIDLLFALLSFRTKVIMSLAVITIFYQLLFNANSFKGMIKKIMPLLIFIAAFLFIFRSVITNTYKLYFTDSYGLSARQALNTTSIKILKDYLPIGVGFGKFASWYSNINYSEYYYKYNLNKIYGLMPQDSSYATDVFWPSILGETGLIGTVIYLIILINTLILLNKNIDKVTKYKFDFILFGFLILIQTIVESFGEASFNSTPQNFIVSLFLGIAIENIYKKHKEEE